MMFLMELLLRFITPVPKTVDIITPILNILDLEENMQKMETAMSSLRRCAIQKDKEATAGKILHGRVVHNFENLLEEACKLFDKVHRLNAEFESFQNTKWHLLSKLIALPSSLCRMHRMSKRALILAEEMSEKTKELRGEGSGSRVVDMFSSTKARAGGYRGKVMETRVEELRSLSMGPGMGKLICVRGMGGVGKTRLFEELHEKYMEEDKDHHDIRVVMIKVSERMDLKTVQRDIARKLMLGWENEDQQVVASRISDTLEENGEYVFLFDDVWEELPLSSIGIRCRENTTTRDGTIPGSCMVVLSTRIFTLCNGADHTILLQCLPEQESLLLFRENTGRSSDLIETNPEIRSLATQIVEECGGLPLALINAGKAFSRVSTVADWEKGVRDMKREPWKVHRMTGNVLEVLRRSYNNLSNDRLRLCFTYFVLMPTNVDDLWLSWLTFYWIGERVIEHWTDIDDADAKRDKLIKDLKEVGLVTVSDPPKLHKMIRAMAMWLGISGERYIAMPEMGLTDAQVGGEITWNNERRISLLHNDICGGWPEEPNCPELLTLLIWQNTPNRALDSGFFRRMCSLKVLDLCSLEHLPKSIGELRSLEFLQLTGTKIRSLPAEIGELVRLRFLNLNESENLQDVPSGIFRRLTSLEYLGLYDTYSNWGVVADGAMIEELYDLEHLKVLSITFDNTTALKALLEPSTRPQSVTVSIVLRDLHGEESIQLPEELGNDMRKLKYMKISHCADLEEIMFVGSNGNGGSTENLSEMELLRLDKVKIMFRGVGAADDNGGTFFGNLLSRIVNFNMMLERSHHDQFCLGNLKILNISKCNRLEELVQDRCEGLFAFPSLKELWLEDLPAMRSICRVPLLFPSLVVLHVVRCPHLRKLPFREESGRMLSEIKGSRRWWDKLDWGDGGQHLRSRFARFFRQVS